MGIVFFPAGMFVGTSPNRYTGRFVCAGGDIGYSQMKGNTAAPQKNVCFVSPLSPHSPHSGRKSNPTFQLSGAPLNVNVVEFLGEGKVGKGWHGGSGSGSSGSSGSSSSSGSSGGSTSGGGRDIYDDLLGWTRPFNLAGKGVVSHLEILLGHLRDTDTAFKTLSSGLDVKTITEAFNALRNIDFSTLGSDQNQMNAVNSAIERIMLMAQIDAGVTNPTINTTDRDNIRNIVETLVDKHARPESQKTANDLTALQNMLKEIGDARNELKQLEQERSGMNTDDPRWQEVNDQIRDMTAALSTQTAAMQSAGFRAGTFEDRDPWVNKEVAKEQERRAAAARAGGNATATAADFALTDTEINGIRERWNKMVSDAKTSVETIIPGLQQVRGTVADTIQELSDPDRWKGITTALEGALNEAQKTAGDFSRTLSDLGFQDAGRTLNNLTDQLSGSLRTFQRMQELSKQLSGLADIVGKLGSQTTGNTATALNAVSGGMRTVGTVAGRAAPPLIALAAAIKVAQEVYANWVAQLEQRARASQMRADENKDMRLLTSVNTAAAAQDAAKRRGDLANEELKQIQQVYDLRFKMMNDEIGLEEQKIQLEMNRFKQQQEAELMLANLTRDRVRQEKEIEQQITRDYRNRQVADVRQNFYTSDQVLRESGGSNEGWGTRAVGVGAGTAGGLAGLYYGGMAGAALGGMLGTAVPIIGNAVGAAVGGAIGAALGGITGAAGASSIGSNLMQGRIGMGGWHTENPFSSGRTGDAAFFDRGWGGAADKAILEDYKKNVERERQEIQALAKDNFAQLNSAIDETIQKFQQYSQYLSTDELKEFQDSVQGAANANKRASTAQARMQQAQMLLSLSEGDFMAATSAGTTGRNFHAFGTEFNAKNATDLRKQIAEAMAGFAQEASVAMAEADKLTAGLRQLEAALRGSGEAGRRVLEAEKRRVEAAMDFLNKTNDRAFDRSRAMRSSFSQGFRATENAYETDTNTKRLEMLQSMRLMHLQARGASGDELQENRWLVEAENNEQELRNLRVKYAHEAAEARLRNDLDMIKKSGDAERSMHQRTAEAYVNLNKSRFDAVERYAQSKMSAVEKFANTMLRNLADPYGQNTLQVQKEQSLAAVDMNNEQAKARRDMANELKVADLRTKTELEVEQMKTRLALNLQKLEMELAVQLQHNQQEFELKLLEKTHKIRLEQIMAEAEYERSLKEGTEKAKNKSLADSKFTTEKEYEAAKKIREDALKTLMDNAGTGNGRLKNMTGGDVRDAYDEHMKSGKLGEFFNSFTADLGRINADVLAEARKNAADATRAHEQAKTNGAPNVNDLSDKMKAANIALEEITNNIIDASKLYVAAKDSGDRDARWGRESESIQKDAKTALERRYQAMDTSEIEKYMNESRSKNAAFMSENERQISAAAMKNIDSISSRQNDMNKQLHSEKMRQMESEHKHSLAYMVDRAKQERTLNKELYEDRFRADQLRIQTSGEDAQRSTDTTFATSIFGVKSGQERMQAVMQHQTDTQYNAQKEQLEQKHRAEKERLEMQGATEEQRARLEQQQKRELGELDQGKAFRDAIMQSLGSTGTLRDMVKEQGVGTKSSLTDAHERIRASAFGHVKDPAADAINKMALAQQGQHNNFMQSWATIMPQILTTLQGQGNAMSMNTINNFNSGLGAGPL